MAQPKSPFLVYNEFLSPKICDSIIDSMECTIPDLDVNHKPVKMIKYSESGELIVFDRLKQIIPEIEEYYGFKYKGTERMLFEWLSADTKSDPICENASYIQKKWVRSRDRDITGIIFLSNYSESVPFDDDFEVYGGKLEFPQHNFGFNPIRGTLVLYPSGPHFINLSTVIHAGDLYQIRFHIAGNLPYLYNPQKFPGTFKDWF